MAVAVKRAASSLLSASLEVAQHDLHERAFVVDADVHMMSRSLLQGLYIGRRAPDGHVDLPHLAAGGVDAAFFSVYTSEAYYPARHEVKNTFRVVEIVDKNPNQTGEVRDHCASTGALLWCHCQ